MRAGALTTAQASARMAAPVIADTYPIQELWVEKSNGWCTIRCSTKWMDSSTARAGSRSSRPGRLSTKRSVTTIGV